VCRRCFYIIPGNSAVPPDLLDRYFFALNEEQRVAVTRKFYSDREPDALVKIAANNVLDFFDWAHESRNKILHSERYPTGFGGDPEIFYLTKRASKRDASSRYMALDLPTLRSTADFMRTGIVRSAEINIHVRYRNSDLSKLHQSMHVYARSNDFPALTVPRRLEMTEMPIESAASQQRQRRRSRQGAGERDLYRILRNYHYKSFLKRTDRPIYPLTRVRSSFFNLY
jgi:hypothetical protein